MQLLIINFFNFKNFIYYQRKNFVGIQINNHWREIDMLPTENPSIRWVSEMFHFIFSITDEKSVDNVRAQNLNANPFFLPYFSLLLLLSLSILSFLSSPHTPTPLLPDHWHTTTITITTVIVCRHHHNLSLSLSAAGHINTTSCRLHHHHRRLATASSICEVWISNL